MGDPGAAWEFAGQKGIAEFTLRDLAERVGMRRPSLYTHFASKNAIYDAMFRQAWSDCQVALAESLGTDRRRRGAVRRWRGCSSTSPLPTRPATS